MQMATPQGFGPVAAERNRRRRTSRIPTSLECRRAPACVLTRDYTLSFSEVSRARADGDHGNRVENKVRPEICTSARPNRAEYRHTEAAESHSSRAGVT